MSRRIVFGPVGIGCAGGDPVCWKFHKSEKSLLQSLKDVQLSVWKVVASLILE